MFKQYKTANYGKFRKIEGYKTFLTGLETMGDGSVLEVGKDYHTNGMILYGTGGYHFCERPEDTFRYFEKQQKIDICKVIGYGEIDEKIDDYYGYYNMYASSSIRIVEKLTRKQLLDIYKELVKDIRANETRVARFLLQYPDLTVSDIDYIGARNLKLPFRY